MRGRGSPNGQFADRNPPRWRARYSSSDVAAIDLRDVDEEARAHRVIPHRPVQRRENVPRVVEAVAREDHALARALEQLAEHDRRIARRPRRGLRARPDQLGRRPSHLPLGERHIEHRQARGGLWPPNACSIASSWCRTPNPIRAARSSGGLSVPDAMASRSCSSTVVLTCFRLARAFGHGRFGKKASSESLPMVGTTSARSRNLLKRSHEHSAT